MLQSSAEPIIQRGLVLFHFVLEVVGGSNRAGSVLLLSGLLLQLLDLLTHLCQITQLIRSVHRDCLFAQELQTDLCLRSFVAQLESATQNECHVRLRTKEANPAESI